MNLGNGQAIRIFQDPWISRPVTFKVLSYEGHTDENFLFADFITPTLQWDVGKLNQFLCREDVDEIMQLPISGTVPDNWIWHYDKRGKFTVKSGYKLSMLSR